MNKAFQCLVHAFERLANPHLYAEEDKGGKQKSLGRSNDGCFRTVVKCPRCKEPWGRKLDGNPDYFYNFLMMGLKSYTCSTCLLEFGALAAIHECPFCKCDQEYHPVHSFSPFFIHGGLPFPFASHPHPWDSYLPLPQLSPWWRLWMLMDAGMTGAML